MSSSSGTQILDQTALAALVMMLLALVKPLIEALPFARPGAPLHGYILRGVLLLLNVAALVAQAAATNTLAPAPGQNAVTVALSIQYQAALASGLSHLAYQGLTKLGAGNGSGISGSDLSAGQ
jgi:hypothetical protein